MANSSQARKRARQAAKHRLRNASHRSRVGTAIKHVVKAIKAGNKEAAEAAYKLAVPVIDKMSGEKIIHKNKAARHKSRLYAHIQAMG
ncbi:MAG: 30S ribosomal protein S20 [Gammaproteobacteria bacterium]|nr:30S ribosomal protein S20 [Gammaproteobacteria bacterium]